MVYIFSKLFAGFFLVPGVFILAFFLIFLFTRGVIRGFSLVCALALYALSTPFVPNLLLSSLENPRSTCGRYADTVVILSGGSVLGQELSLGNESLKRAVYGLKVAKERSLPVVFSGAGHKSVSEADSFEQTIKNIYKPFDVKIDEITLEDRSLDTYENAKYTKEILGEKSNILLVTSAYHMPRAKLLFEYFGFRVTPCATDFKVEDGERLHWSDILPSMGKLRDSQTALREYFGLLNLKIRGIF